MNRATAIAFACSLLVAVTAALTLGVGPVGGVGSDRPPWVLATLGLILTGNVAAAGLVYRRGTTPVVAAVLTAVGTTTILAGRLLIELSYAGYMDTSWYEVLAVIAFGLPLPGVVVAGIGILSLDVDALAATVDPRGGPFLALAFGTLAAEVAFRPFSTALWLLPFLWATGGGYFLIPLALLVGIRWWGANGTLAGLAFVVLATTGVVLFLLTPMENYDFFGTLAGCFGVQWSSLGYSIDWSTMRVSYHDGCNSRGFTVDPRPARTGVLLLLVGAVGERIVALWRD